MKIVAISGSLRKNSYNTFLLEAAINFLPESASVAIYDISDIPLYNQDLDGDTKPESVERLKRAITEADALLIATPEYNYSIPGGLKNAIDWASRPGYKSPLAHKPVAVMSASMSSVGGARAQNHLKQILMGVLSNVYTAPEFIVPSAHQVFSENGKIQDADTLKRLERFINDFSATLRHN